MLNNFRMMALAGAVLALAHAMPAVAADKADGKSDAPDSKAGPERIFQPRAVSSSGSVTIGGKTLDYGAVAGTIVVHPEGWDDAQWREKPAPKESPAQNIRGGRLL